MREDKERRRWGITCNKGFMPDSFVSLCLFFFVRIICQFCRSVSLRLCYCMKSNKGLFIFFFSKCVWCWQGWGYLPSVLDERAYETTQVHKTYNMYAMYTRMYLCRFSFCYVHAVLFIASFFFFFINENVWQIYSIQTKKKKTWEN